jgi:hypothetical protein
VPTTLSLHGPGDPVFRDRAPRIVKGQRAGGNHSENGIS